MKSNWIISITVTIVIWGTGVFGYFFLSDYLTNRLDEPSLLSTVNAIPVNVVDSTNKLNQRDLKGIIAETQKLVVKIVNEDGSLGSGFLYNNKGDIITNAHVAANSREVLVVMADSREYVGRVIGISTQTDVAVVRVPELVGTTPLLLALTEERDIGDEVLALGSPLGLQNTVTTGIISGVNREFDIPPFQYKNVYQISAPIAPGNSGGPLIDRQTGEVLGINSAAADQGSIGFSIPIKNIYTLVEGWSREPMTTLPTIQMNDR